MQTTALQKMELINKISVIPEERIKEVKTFIDFILSQSDLDAEKPINLQGIWKDKGFEKIDVEAELKKIRKEMESSILKREF
jgi:hypothetical protein